MKGYVKFLAAFIVVIIVFVAVDFILASNLNRECQVSSEVSKAYRIINAIEFAKLNALQALNFSFNKTLTDMGISASNLKTDPNLRQNFLEELKKNFESCKDPLSFAEIAASVELNSLDFDVSLSKVVADITIEAHDSTFQASTDTKIYKEF